MIQGNMKPRSDGWCETGAKMVDEYGNHIICSRYGIGCPIKHIAQLPIDEVKLLMRDPSRGRGV